MSDQNLIGAESQDADLLKAQKSMGSRVDPDETPVVTPDPEPATPPAVVEPAADPVEPPANDELPANDPADPADPKDLEDPADPAPARAPKYIPIPEHKDKMRALNDTISTLQEEIENLKTAGAKTPDELSTDLQSIADNYGIDEEGMKKITKVIASTLMPAEKQAQLDILLQQNAERQEIDAYANEYTAIAQPQLVELFGEIPAEKQKEIAEFIDKAAHSKDFHDKPLDLVVFKHREEIKKLLNPTPETPATPPVKGLESTRVGNGKPVSLTAKDFETATDFAPLGEMDDTTRNQVIQEMNPKTYANYISWAGSQDKTVEVYRNGRKIKLAA